jgi:hypothetical protein
MAEQLLHEITTAVADIIQLCQRRPELTAMAIARLVQIRCHVDTCTGPPDQAGTAIQNHLGEMRRQQCSINPPTWVYREIAKQLADFHHLPFDPRQRRRQEDIIKWLNEYWNLIEGDFFHMLDNHPDRNGKKR